MCFDRSLLVLRRSNLRLHTADAADYVLNLASQVHKGLADPLDIVFIDAFDGNDDVPNCFCDPGKGHTQQCITTVSSSSQRLLCSSDNNHGCKVHSVIVGITADSEVLEALATALHPVHGSLIMNLHGGGIPTSTALLALFSGWLPFSSKQESSGYHHSTDKGQAVLQIASTLRYVMSAVL